MHVFVAKFCIFPLMQFLQRNSLLMSAKEKKKAYISLTTRFESSVLFKGNDIMIFDVRNLVNLRDIILLIFQNGLVYE